MAIRTISSMYKSLLIAILLLGAYAHAAIGQPAAVQLYKGLVLTHSSNVVSTNYILPGEQEDVFKTVVGPSISCTPVIIIEGNNIEVDFQQAQLTGSSNLRSPEQFYGVGILVKGRNITIKNARIRGYKVGIIADGVEQLRLINCDFSYNYRPRLHSGREKEAFSDWLSYHNNEQDQWLRYGAGVYLKNCEGAEVYNCKMTGNQNALLMSGCHRGLIWNNAFQFNSGLGIGMYRSSNNRVMHNRLDWNVRGYSHHYYQRGQDSAGILVYEQSSNNLFAFNSATHSGDGFFLWAGQTTMDTGSGGCNDNMVFGNDFSYSPTNGVELTFSRNEVRGNLIQECTYGIWGGYSYESVFAGNYIAGCRTGIAIEHGQNNRVQQNLFQGDSVGIQFWANSSVPADWVYAQKRDCRSRNGWIDRNVFFGVRTPLSISNSQAISVNGENLFYGFEELLKVQQPNDSLLFLRNNLYGTPSQLSKALTLPDIERQKKLNTTHLGAPENPYQPLEMPVEELKEPDSLKGGISTALPAHLPRGRKFIIMGEWGPYDFKRPFVMLDTVAGSFLSLTILGPSGDWKLREMKGVKTISARNGSVPAVLVLELEQGQPDVQLRLEYTGPETITTEFGEKVAPGKPYFVDFNFFKPEINWTVNYFPYNHATDPLLHADALETLQKNLPFRSQQVSPLWLAWWGKPFKEMQDERFVTVSTASIQQKPGAYIASITADDGVRLYLDGKCIVDRWVQGEAETNRVKVQLTGRHELVIEHFNAKGFSALDFRLLRAED